MGTGWDILLCSIQESLLCSGLLIRLGAGQTWQGLCGLRVLEAVALACPADREGAEFEELARNGWCHFSSAVGPTAVAHIRSGLSLLWFVLVLVMLIHRRAATSSQMPPAFPAIAVLVES